MAKKSEATLILRIKEIGGKAIEGVRKRLGSLKPSMGQVIEGAKMMGAAFVALGAASIKFARDAGKFEGVQKSFRALAASQGQDAKKMLDNMKELSQGTISDMKLMEQANNALLLGLPVDRFGDMLKVAQSASVATGQSMDFMLNSIVTGMGRGSKLMLDNLGILVDVKTANEDYAKAMGIVGRQLTDSEKKQAFVNKSLEIGLANAEKLGEGNLNLSQRMDQLTASAQNLGILFGQTVAPAVSFLTTKLKEFADTSEATASSEGLSYFFQAIATGAIVAWNMIEFVGKQIGTAVAAWSTILGNFFTGNWSKALQGAKMGFTETFGNIKGVFVDTMEDVSELHAGFAQARTDRLKQESSDAMAIKQEQAIAEQEFDAEAFDAKKNLAMERRQLEIDAIGADNAQKLALQQKKLDLELKQAKTAKQREDIWQQKMDVQEKQRQLALAEFEKKQREEKLAGTQRALGQIASLQNSGSKELAAIGKAAAIANITINTAEGVSAAWALGPILGPPLAGLVAVAGAAQAAKVAGVQLAEGGIVPSTPGGIQATIGEGGRSEAVIPLPDDFDPDEGIAGQGAMIINFNGPLMGDEFQAREFAQMVDRELFELRRTNESLAFDEDVI